MQNKFGSLEHTILTALWKLEQDGKYSNSVLDVYNILKQNEGNKRAYTTIKTVMDRLTTKQLLMRFKQGRKFCYKTVYTSNQSLSKEIDELAKKYCSGSIELLIKNINNIYKSENYMEANLVSAK